jgi:hypothetical protein
MCFSLNRPDFERKKQNVEKTFKTRFSKTFEKRFGSARDPGKRLKTRAGNV